MDTLLQDVRYAARTLLRTPGFTAAAVLTLALGIGANTAVFSVLEGVLLRSLPFPEAERLVDIKSIHEDYRGRVRGGGTSPFTDFETLRTATGAFEDLAAARAEQPVLIGPEGAERVKAWAVTANFFPLLGGQPFVGRGFLPEEDRPGSAPVVVLSYDFWQSRFGGDRQVLGRSLTLDNVSYTIVGVMGPGFRTPLGFRHPDDAQLWHALGSMVGGGPDHQWARQRSFWVLGRLQAGSTPGGAQAALDVVTRRAREAGAGNRWVPVVTPLHEYLVGHMRTSLLLILAAAGLVLLVASANVTNLLLSRAVAREPELAVRVTLGATRARLFRHGLTESVLLALAGGVVGVLVALWSVPLLVRLAGPELPHLSDIGVNARVLLLALGVSTLAGLLAGLAPALRASQYAPASALKARSPSAGGGTWRHRSTDTFIVAQMALTLVLLSGAGLLVRSFVGLVRLDPGFDPNGVVTAHLRLPDTRYRSGETRAAFLQRVLNRVRDLPGVTAAAASTGMPLAGGAVGTVSLPGRLEDVQRPMAWLTDVSEDFFRVLGIPLKSGGPGEAQGVLIDEAAARAYFPGEDPLGKQITYYGNRTRTVTGVVGNTRQQSLHEPPPPHIYEPLGTDVGNWVKILVRASDDAGPTASAVRRAIQEVDATVPVDRVAPMHELMGDARATQRFYALLLAVFAAVGLAVAGTGAYGIAAYAVTRRTQEIGIRMALGAGRLAVLGLILSRGLVLALVGIALGIGGALGGTRVLRSYLFEIGPRDPAVLASVALLLLGAVLLANWLPARRATRVDPMVALRYE